MQNFFSASIIHQVTLCCVTRILILFITLSSLYNLKLLDHFEVVSASRHVVWGSERLLDAGRECCNFVREFSVAQDVGSDYGCVKLK